MHGRFRPLFIFALGLAALHVADAARADPPTASERETARRKMREGRVRREAGDLRGAAESFRSAERMMHAPTTAFELAQTLAALGQLLEARALFVRIVESPAAGAEPKPFTVARQRAKVAVETLAPRIPTLRVVVGSDGLEAVELELDGDLVLPSALSAPRSVNPGHHVVVARTKSRRTQIEIDIAEGETKELRLEWPSPTPAAEPPPPVRIAPSPPPAEPLRAPPLPVARGAPAPSGAAIGRPLAVAGFAVAGAGVAVGAIAGVMSLRMTKTLEGACARDVCSPGAYGTLHDARIGATTANIAFVVGATGLAAGVIGLVLTGRSAQSASAGRVRLVMGAGALGFDGAF